MKIKNYLIKHNDDKVAIIVPETEMEINDFPFLESNLYVSKSRMIHKIIFIMTPDHSHVIEIIDIDMEKIIKIMKNKTLTFVISNENGKLIDGYDFDVKIIK